jgi:hypothetical protein
MPTKSEAPEGVEEEVVLFVAGTRFPRCPQVAGALSGDATLRAWAERLRDRRRTKLVDSFEGESSKRLQAIAERHTPELARSWKFRMNMRMDDFLSVMEKFGSDHGRT